MNTAKETVARAMEIAEDYRRGDIRHQLCHRDWIIALSDEVKRLNLALEQIIANTTGAASEGAQLVEAIAREALSGESVSEEIGPECENCGYEDCRCNEEWDPYEAAGESRFGLPGGGSL